MTNIEQFIDLTRGHIDVQLDPIMATLPYSRYPSHRKLEELTVAEFFQAVYTLMLPNQYPPTFRLDKKIFTTVNDYKNEAWSVVDIETGEVIAQFSACSEIDYTNDFAKQKFIKLI